MGRQGWWAPGLGALGLVTLGACNSSSACSPDEITWMNRCVRRCQNIPGALCERDGAAIPDAFLDAAPQADVADQVDAAPDQGLALDAAMDSEASDTGAQDTAADGRDGGQDAPAPGHDADADAEAADAGAPDSADTGPAPRSVAIQDRGTIEGMAGNFTPSTQAQSAYALPRTGGRVAVAIDGDAHADCRTASQSNMAVGVGQCVPERRLLTFTVPAQVGSYEVDYNNAAAPGKASVLDCRSGAVGYGYGLHGSIAVTALDAASGGHVALLFDVTFGDGQVRGRADAIYCP